MTDYVIKAPSRAAMEQGMDMIGMRASGVIRPSGRFNDTGTDWAIAFADVVREPTGNLVDDGSGAMVPEYAALAGSYLYARSNGAQDLAPVFAQLAPLGIEVWWSSADLDQNGQPVELPDWFPRLA